MLRWTVSKLGHIPSDQMDAWEVAGHRDGPTVFCHGTSLNVTLPASNGDAANEREVWVQARMVA
jgi:hypothetical protein